MTLCVPTHAERAISGVATDMAPLRRASVADGEPPNEEVDEEPFSSSSESTGQNVQHATEHIC